jgi:hypothetical protein
MGQKVSLENGMPTNLSKKERYEEAVQEVFDCCQEDNYDRLLELLTENTTLGRCVGRVSVSTGYFIK